MSEQEAVENVVEPTTETESAPVETNTDTSGEAPVVESNDTEKNVSPSVPYERFKEINDKYKNLEEQVATILQSQQAPQTQYEEPAQLEPEAARAVQSLANQVVEQREDARFRAKHAKDFEKDPLLQAAFMVEVNKTMAKGQYIDREAALEQAKAALDARVKPAVEQAKADGVNEGRDIAKTKQQLGAVGETGKQPEVDPSNLSANELAKYYNLPRVN